jgi:hypothetical protein
VQPRAWCRHGRSRLARVHRLTLKQALALAPTRLGCTVRAGETSTKNPDASVRGTAGNQDAAIAKNRGGVRFARRRHAAGRDKCAGRRVVQFRARDAPSKVARIARAAVRFAPAARTMPLVSQLSVCQTRRHAMFPVEANACLTGSYNSALNNRPQSSPPANNTFPFVSAAAAE